MDAEARPQGMLQRNFGLPARTHPALIFLSILALAGLTVLGMSWLPDAWFQAVDVATAQVLGLVLDTAGMRTVLRSNSVRYILDGQMRTLTIGYGCDGLLGAAILCSAILPFPSRLLPKLAGLGLGLVMVLIVNQMRLVGLAVALRYLEPKDFEFYHVVVGQIFVLLAVCVFWSAWTSRALKPWAARPEEAAE